jgi:predicted  nucleic acid-binding Zn-ribbon protein
VTEELRLHWALHEIDEQAVAREHALAKQPEVRREQTARVNAARTAVAAIDQRLTDSQKRRRTLDREIAAYDVQQHHFEKQVLAVTTQHQLEALQHEIAAVRAKRDVLETEALEKLDGEERDTKARPEKAHALERAEAEATTTLARLDTEAARIKSELATLEAKRAEVAGALPPATRTRYEKLRAGRAGRAVAAIENGACGGCHRGLPPAALQEARRREKLLMCDGCGRLLMLAPEPGSA